MLQKKDSILLRYVKVRLQKRFLEFFKLGNVTWSMTIRRLRAWSPGAYDGKTVVWLSWTVNYCSKLTVADAKRTSWAIRPRISIWDSQLHHVTDSYFRFCSGFLDVCKYGPWYGCGMLIIHLPLESLRSRYLLAPEQEGSEKRNLEILQSKK